MGRPADGLDVVAHPDVRGLFPQPGRGAHTATLGTHLFRHAGAVRRHLGWWRAGGHAGRRSAGPGAGDAVYRRHVRERGVVLFGLSLHDRGVHRAGVVALYLLAVVPVVDPASRHGHGRSGVRLIRVQRHPQTLRCAGNGLPPDP
ncbi:hypothetical protein D3C85_913870 [compost metagenome]